MLVVWREQREKVWLLTEGSARRCSQQHGYSINKHHAIKIFTQNSFRPESFSHYACSIYPAHSCCQLSSPRSRRPVHGGLPFPGSAVIARAVRHPRGTATSPERRTSHCPAPGDREGTSPPPSPGKGEPEPTRRALAAHRRHPRGGAGTVPPAGERRRGGGGSHPGVAGRARSPANLGRPGHPAGGPGERARRGRRWLRDKGLGWGAGELRREFGRGPAPLAAPLLSWRPRLRHRGWPVPSALAPPSPVRPADGALARPPLPRAALPARTRSPRGISHPGAKLSRPASPEPERPAGEGPRRLRLREHPGSPLATAPPRLPLAPPPEAVPRAHWLRLRWRAAGGAGWAEPGAHSRWPRGRCGSLPLHLKLAPRAQAAPGGLPAAPAPSARSAPAVIVVPCIWLAAEQLRWPGESEGRPAQGRENCEYRAPQSSRLCEVPAAAGVRGARIPREADTEPVGRWWGWVSGSRRLGRVEGWAGRAFQPFCRRLSSYWGCCRCTPQDRYSKETRDNRKAVSGVANSYV